MHLIAALRGAECEVGMLFLRKYDLRSVRLRVGMFMVFPSPFPAG